ncbi:Mitochondrial thiamine pyrophosphate carrier [Acropora cervicornis]|uniref:Mitochondrial thiamine pyrophosphate carrier n=1 Tax=Acropora cervicornis TaxID=6130 RepID=A0AAD9Q2Q0_ACRCE|nr:Mitochondrial thiamine pyrophosphate carrier [Acropora cervicornis]
MVGYDPSSKSEGKALSPLQCGFCGSLSGMFTRLLVQPLDVLKIRFQLQIEPTSKYEQYTLELLQNGVDPEDKDEKTLGSIKSPWLDCTVRRKGHVPAQVLSVVYGCVQFMAFETMTELMWKTYPLSTSPQWKPVSHFVCGGVAGCLSSTVAQPLDVIRTRLVAQGEPKVYKNIYQATNKMYINEGLASFYKGLVPTLVQIFPHAGLQFGFYAFFKTTWEMSFGIKVYKDSYQPADVEESLVCGAMAGICSKGIIYPLDMVKKRLQEEGVHGFFKGLAPSTCKAGLSVAVIFCTYEQCLSVIRGYAQDDEEL